MPLDVIDQPPRPTELDTLRRALDAHREAFRQDPYPPAAARIDRLRRLEKAIVRRRERIRTASSADFGHRAPDDVDLTDGVASLIEIRHAYRSVRRWMRPRRIKPHWMLLPARAFTFCQPLGVVGIVSPWNYPVLLAVAPLVNVLAAGNRAMIKPSELAPRVNEVVAEIVEEAFPDGEVTLHTGGPDAGEAFSRLPFDHLVFTGSSATGRLVYQEAARNLVPVTLELGGRSPFVIDPGADLSLAVRWGIFGKLINSGQTCIATDHIYVHGSRLEACLREIERFHAHLRPRIGDNVHHTGIVDERHLARLHAMKREAEDAGARVITYNPAGEDLSSIGRKFPLTVVVDPPPELAASCEEIFGTLLPIHTYETHDEVIGKIRSGERPLALYLFTRDAGIRDRYLKETHSGVFSCDGTFGFWAVPDLPLGGVGRSGIGRYQGEEGFKNFSHLRACYRQGALAPIRIVAHNPPSRLSRRVLDFLIGR